VLRAGPMTTRQSKGRARHGLPGGVNRSLTIAR
jgi:hypothetical protein